MSGAFLVGFFVIAVFCFLIIRIFDPYNDEAWGVVGWISFAIGVCMLIAIPANRIATKRNVIYAEVFQTTLDYNRANEGDFNVLERTSVIEEINSCNSHIIKWEVTGQKWYLNKWYLHPSTQTAKRIK